MNVLHILSNFRWTERAEPAVDAVIAQQAQGINATFACGRTEPGTAPEDCVEWQAKQKGVTPTILELTKHLRVRQAMRDVPLLRQLIRSQNTDVVHCHMPNANLLVSLAVRTMRKRPLVVRSIYSPHGPQWPARYHLLSQPYTDGLVVLSSEVKAQMKAKFSRNPDRVAVIEPGIDLDRFKPDDDLRLTDVPLPADAFVVGMVTAIGKRRRLDIVLEAIASLADKHPNIHLMIVGRGKIEKFVTEPAERLGIADRVHLAGYCRGEKLVAAYNTMDVLAYPHPGTDKSCRTVREALACGTPVVASHTGYLMNLIDDGVTGMLTAPNPESHSRALATLIQYPEQLQRMGKACSETARRRFDRVVQSSRMIEAYRHLMATMNPGNYLNSPVS